MISVGIHSIFFKVPISFNFVHVVDMYFKIHKVFNVDFIFKIKPMLTFMNHFIFKFPLTRNDSITPAIQMVASQLIEDESAE